ncbi:hypothetical protein [Desulfofustis glycolicus]|uniref:Uncharacterized protein n=1 Tax=Desulfofustis glycolicus DSM 9705 TaxID=1121409 RepID=A0A1M5XQR4_9BACT|nr:hypothetical protein [Desulfofustis glycolicus]SHI01874.1 hypothetical protein SAMN02745124_03239 [Desulfofustis glycolicus DSM 9705]
MHDPTNQGLKNSVPRAFLVSVFSAPVSNTTQQEVVGWDELCQRFKNDLMVLPDTSSKAKADNGQYFVRGVITDQRDDAHLAVCYLLPLDVDKPLPGGVLPTVEEIHDALGDIIHAVYPTITPGRSRIVVPVDLYHKDSTATLTKQLYDYCRSVGLEFAYAGESGVKSQPFFYGQCLEKHLYRCHINNDGYLFNPDPALPLPDENGQVKDDGGKRSEGNHLADFTDELETGTIHQAAKKYAGWLARTSNLTTKQIFNDINVLIERFCSDKDKVARWHDSERKQLEQWFADNVEPGGNHDVKDDESEERASSSAQLVIKAVLECAELKHDADGTAFILTTENDIRQVWPLESQQARNWISHKVYRKHGIVANRNVMSDVTNTLAGMAIFEGEEIAVYLRTAQVNERYFLDLCRDDWSAVMIEPGSWRVINSKESVYFRRTSAMRALPLPVSCSHKELPALLNSHLNMSVEDIRLTISYLLECLMPGTEYPILELLGSPGSGKSTAQEMLREILDPNRVNLRAAPGNVEDVFVSAANNLLVSYNNLSRITKGMSDALCSLSTGGGHAGRKFYTNTDEVAVDIQRPVVLNGISSLAKQTDLIDRVIRISLQPINSRENRAKKNVMERFTDDLPKILGSLLSCLAEVLRVLPTIKLDHLPRMADFAKTCSALETVYGWNDLLAAYYRNRAVSFEESLDASPAITAVIDLIERQGEYLGTIGNLFNIISEKAADNFVKTSRGLSERLKLHIPALKAIGIMVDFNPVRRKDGYHVNIKKVEKQCSQRSPHSPGIKKSSTYEGKKGEHRVNVPVNFSDNVHQNSDNVHHLNGRRIVTNEQGEHGEHEKETSLCTTTGPRPTFGGNNGLRYGGDII